MRALLNIIEQLGNIGVRHAESRLAKRSIILSNYISIILSFALIFLFLVNSNNQNWNGFISMLINILIFSFPILLNYWSLHRISKLLLCWIPPLVIIWRMASGMKELEVIPITFYDGIRIFLIATSCIPYLLIDRKSVALFILGVIPTLGSLLFFDSILELLNVGYSQKGAFDPGYSITGIRSVTTYFIVGGSCFVLKYIVDKTDSFNQKLIDDLEKKNDIIKRQSESELHQLNQQLEIKVRELTERELILKRSQEIAKVGSWVFNLEDKNLYWSDQMFEIFGTAQSMNLRASNLTSQLFGEYGKLIDEGNKELILSEKPYDYTLQTKTPIGYTKWVRVVGFPMVVNKQVSGIFGIVHDVTFFKESENKIRVSERSYKSLFEQASDAIIVCDFNGVFLDVNKAMCDLTGYTKDELLKIGIADILDRDELISKPIRFDKLALGEQIFNERKVIRKDKSVLFVEVNVKMIDTGKLMAIARDVTGRKEMELEKEKARYALNERIKELTTLYKISQILQTERKPVHELLQEIVNIIPGGWQYHEITAARITLASMEFVTSNFKEFKSSQFTEFVTPNGMHGTIEVVYLEERPYESEGPFFAEERQLIEMIADMIRIYLSRRYESEALRRAEANQSATINNTNFIIWSVNREYELISFNRPFVEFNIHFFGLEVKIGAKISDYTSVNKELTSKWIELYNRALAGEVFKINTELGKSKYEFSLNPIIEVNRVIGVSVIGEDITDRAKLQDEMLAVNKQLGELKLMALRSVMNPHFIFNCLNSIQYYILENDQLNAVNYLSTFSKLIRSILSNSVKARVRLSEELEMLRQYIELESIRFENKFDSEIDVAPDIEVESVEIPSMLIQPYVENAILHGLNNKKERGLLKISIWVEGGIVNFQVTDNGIGRIAAEKLKWMKINQHQSMGTALTEERLRLINEKGMVSVEIEDLYENGDASGTKVSVRIME